MMEDDTNLVPPPGPPPLLSIDQIKHLSFQGWLPIVLPETLSQSVTRLFDASSTFFENDDETKRALYPSRRGTELGYYVVENEKEYLTFRHHRHPDSRLEQLVAEAWAQAGLLLYRILCDLARVAQVPLMAWDHLVKHSLDLQGASVNLNHVVSLLRLFKYCPSSGVAAEHTDLGLLTLCIGNGKGLQVLNRKCRPPQYEDAEGPTVVVGDTLRMLMNDRVRAGLHRVVGTMMGRSSIIYALRPNLQEPTDLTMFGGNGVVDTAKLYRQVKGSKYNINATKDIRDRQLKAQKEQQEQQERDKID